MCTSAKEVHLAALFLLKHVLGDDVNPVSSFLKEKSPDCSSGKRVSFATRIEGRICKQVISSTVSSVENYGKMHPTPFSNQLNLDIFQKNET